MRASSPAECDPPRRGGARDRNRARSFARALLYVGTAFAAALAGGTLAGPGSEAHRAPSRPHDAKADHRTFDGQDNHPRDRKRGAAGQPFRRLVPSLDRPPTGRPSPRDVSNSVHLQRAWSVPDPHGCSILFAGFGQFLSHDIALRAKAPTPRFLRVGAGDPMFPAGTRLAYVPNAPHPETGAPYNRVTSWIDASMVYGSDARRAAALRTFSGGRLRTSDGDQLPRYGLFDADRRCALPAEQDRGPWCTPALENENPRRERATKLFLAGDIRANENPVLLSLHTIFVREHNRYARSLARAHPRWDDEQLYQEARRWVGALIQAVTFFEYLPRLVGPRSLPRYAGYNPDRAGTVSIELTAAALRFGHSQLGPTLFRNAPNGARFAFSDVSLKAAFFAPPLYEQAGGGPGAWLLGAAAFLAQRVDLLIVEDVRNYLFGNLRGGLDVAAINIAIGRASLGGGFNEIRVALDLERLEDFDALTRDARVADRLRTLYRTVDRLDPWVGMLAEDPVEGTPVGSTLRATLIEAFARLRDGDRFYFENDPVLRDRRHVLRETKLGQIIRRNLRGAWAGSAVPENVFTAASGKADRDDMPKAMRGASQRRRETSDAPHHEP